MYAAKQASGLWGEDLAAKHLKRNGYSIIGRRVKIFRDEIDIIATLPFGENNAMKQVVFVEVKTRASEIFGGGLAAVDKRKRHALCRAALRYLRNKPTTIFRFDIIEIIGSPASATPPSIRHYENAFNTKRNQPEYRYPVQ